VTLADAPPSVLVVDDEESIHSPIRRYLQQQGYAVSSAMRGDEALDLLGRQRVSCVLLDVQLPDGSGVELVPRILAIDPDVAILMLTAAADATTATLCMQRGATDYLTKPVDLDVLGRAIRRALGAEGRARGTPRASRLLEREVAARSAELREERGRLERLSVATLEALVNALEAKDPFLRGHSARVADLSAMVAAELGADDEEIERVRTAGRLHDIGKIGIREDILNKQGPLTDEEYEHVKRHVVVGTQILSPLVHLQEIIAYVRGHHERWDGEGYPDGLAGTAIPFGARIIGAVEIYDALTTSRPYQEKMDSHFAVERLGDLIGNMIDPEVHHALAAVVNRHQVLTFVDEGQGRA
jgi:putative nucleotidyltransferase with HDIG domain